MLYDQRNHENVIQKFKESLDFFKLHCRAPLDSVENERNSKTVETLLRMHQKDLMNTLSSERAIQALDQKEEKSAMGKLNQMNNITQEGMKSLLKELEFQSLKKKEFNQ